MRINADKERSIFWFMFDQTLTINGKPFEILHEMGAKTIHWAAVNSSKAMADKMLSINFSVQQKEAYVHIYIRDDLELYSIFRKHEEEIKNTIGDYIIWKRGDKNPNTRSIRVSREIDPGNYRSYQKVINEFIPIVLKFIEVVNKYGQGEFFR